MEEESFEEFGKTSKINSAMLVNATLNNIWVNYFRYFTHGEFLNANSELDCIWTILGGEKKTKNDKKEEDYAAIEIKLSQTGILQNSISVKGFNKINEQQIRILQKQKKVLLEKALFLRKLQNRQGKGTAYEDEEGFD